MTWDDVDWSRLAEPQNGGYDTDRILAMAVARGFEPTAVAGRATIFDGAVLAEPAPNTCFPAACVPVEADHPNVRGACGLLKTAWPTAYDQCRRLLDRADLFLDTESPQDHTATPLSNHGGTFGHIMATINNYLGLAESFVHETAHHKLRAMGVGLEASERLVRNSADVLYMSPIILDRLRPMSAVLHAQYAFTHVVELNLRVVRSNTHVPRNPMIVRCQLADKVPKLEFGETVIRENIELDEQGRAFMQGYREWFTRVRDEAWRIFEGYGVEPVPFLHPMGDGQLPSDPARDSAPAAREGDQGLAEPAYCPRRVNGLEATPLMDEMVIYVPRRKQAVSLNESARTIWEAVDDRRTVSEIADMICEKYGTRSGEIRSHVRMVIADFRRMGLVV